MWGKKKNTKKIWPYFFVEPAVSRIHCKGMVRYYANYRDVTVAWNSSIYQYGAPAHCDVEVCHTLNIKFHTGLE